MFQVNLALREGSGHFFVNTSVKGIVDVVFQEAQGAVQVKTKKQKKKHIWGRRCRGVTSVKYMMIVVLI